MRFSKYTPRSAGTRVFVAVATLAALSSVGLLVTRSDAAQTAVPLGTTSSFVVLAGAGVTNTGPTTLNGDLGTYPTTSITGTSGLTLNGTNHAGDSVTQGAQTDLVTAYNTAAGEGPTIPVAGDLTGLTLTPGVYNSASSLGLSGALTLNAGGDPNAVFVFQAGSTLTTASGSRISLINGAQSCNVFWQVGSSATLGTGSSFIGTVFALTSITATTGATIDGRLLARNGAVTLDTNTITASLCAATTGAPTTTAPTSSTITTTTTKVTTTTKPASTSPRTSTTLATPPTSTPTGAKTPTTTTTPSPGTVPAPPAATTVPPSSARPPRNHTPGFTG